MPVTNPSPSEIREILKHAESIAVVGLSDNPNRVSYQISEAMQEEGYRIIPVNPEIKESLGKKAYDTLRDAEQEESFDIINVFRRPEFLQVHAEEAVHTRADVFWTQQGIYSEKVYQFLKENGKTVVMDQCIKVAHSMMVSR